MLRLARVAAVHPEDHSVDLVMTDDYSRFVGVQVLAPTAGTNAGVFDMPDPTSAGDKWTLSESKGDDMLAVCSMLAGAGQPIVLGFLYPQVNGMLFADRNRRVVRHASDVYSTIDGDGNVELAHPNGTYVRIGTTPDHEDLTGKDFDGNWKIGKNTGQATHLRIVVANAGDAKATINIDPSGNILVEHAGNLTVQTDGNASVTVSGTATVTSGGQTKVVAPSVRLETPQTTCTGALIVQGLLTYQAGLVGSGGAGATMTGNLNVTGNVATTGALTNNSKDVGSGHRHASSGGTGTGGAPI